MSAKSKASPALKVMVTHVDEGSSSGWRNCVVGEHIRFVTEGLESYCFAQQDPLVFDLLMLAAAIEVCDKSCRRPRHGWRRTLALDVPVHDVAHWRQQHVSDSLHDVLMFLTGDSWTVTFRPRTSPAARCHQSSLPLPTNVGAVIPYSDGLDSRAVAAIEGRSMENVLMRVRLGSARDAGGSSTVGHFSRVPFSVKTLVRNGESSVRSRAFKFTSMAGIAAYLSRAHRIIIPESMQGSLGPLLVPVGQSYEDYRNSPHFADRMSKFLNAVLGTSLSFHFPRLWFTKAETLTEFIRMDANADWMSTRSCWQQSRQISVNGSRRQCGFCAACLLRRMSVHAAGLVEAPGTYAVENLSAPTLEAASDGCFDTRKLTKSQHQYAIAAALHLDHMAEFGLPTDGYNAMDFAVRQLSRSMRLEYDEVHSNLERVIGQHRTEWHEFMISVGSGSFLSNWTRSGQP